MPVVDPEVTQLKLDREIELWHENAGTYRKRGWLLLERRGVEVDVGFLARLPLGPQSVPVMTACVRLDTPWQREAVGVTSDERASLGSWKCANHFSR